MRYNTLKIDWRKYMNKAVLYLRLSKEDMDKISEGDDSASIKNQRLLLTDYALAHDFQIVDTYSDDNESGLYDNRPEFERMIEDAKLGKFNVIIAKTQARFSRNMEHIEKYLHHDFQILGIRFIGVADGVDTADDSNKKTRQINGLVNEWYCEDLSKNIRSAFRAKMKNGQYLGSSCPYGYVKDPLDHNHLIIDEYAADVVREIFKLYLQGVGKTKIGRIIGERGILIPTLYKRKVQGLNYYNANEIETTKVWSYQTIHQILNNQTYIGNMVQNKVNTISFKDKKKKHLPQSEWIIVENTHEAIIPGDIFDRVQEMQKVRTKDVNMKTPKNNGIFSGILYCADCKHTMSRRYKRRGNHEFVGYMCATYKSHGNAVCRSHSIDYDDLCEVVLLSIQQEARKILSDNDVDNLKKSATISKREESIEKQIEIINIERDKIKKYKQKSYEAYIDDIIPITDYKNYIKKYDEELKELDVKICQLEDEKNISAELDEEYRTWVDKFSEYIDIEELTREIVIELIEKIEVKEDGSIKIYYRFKNPYEK